MENLVFDERALYNCKILFLSQQLNKTSIAKYYLPHLSRDEVVFIGFRINEKMKVNEIRECFTQSIEPIIVKSKASVLVITNAKLFKALTNRTDSAIGYIVDSQFTSVKVVYCPSTESIFYNPAAVQAKIKISLEATTDFISGSFTELGKSIIRYSFYPNTEEDIKKELDKLLELNTPLTIDVETFSLKHYSAGLASISFAWNKHEGIAFQVDTDKNSPNKAIRALLKDFFIANRQKLIFHNASFDLTVIIYQLFMRDIKDTVGLLEGLSIIKEFEDTKIITYLATNSCAGNTLGLKKLAHEFAGNYALEDIGDVTKIPLDKLLEYNLIDVLSTWFVYETFYPRMVSDGQKDIYENIFKLSLVDIIQMQLTGIPVNPKRVKEVKDILTAEENNLSATINNSPIISEFTQMLNIDWVNKRNAELKKKRVSLEDAKESFNYNSKNQLQKLLYNLLNLPVLSNTENGQPSVNKATLQALKDHTTNKDILELLDALINMSNVNKIITSFIPALEEAVPYDSNTSYLFGNFNLGGTVSGRESSNNPNLQNIPNNSTYGKLIKSCFQAPTGWMLVGIDFASLEDRINALLTKDPNKLCVYEEGYDGHSLRAYAYFKDKMPDIKNTVESINSIGSTYKELRQASKAPTFALTYGGTYSTLMRNCGFDEITAKSIEANYHKLYAQSDKWVADKLKRASIDGYVTAAFGLRVRTPLLQQKFSNNRIAPNIIEAEGRTAGNALGQSWGLLNNRACSEFMAKVRTSEFKYSILPVAHIHDAQYYLITNRLESLMFLNEHLVAAVEWQDHDDIRHDKVKLGGTVSVFFPSWEKEIAIPNNATKELILELASKTRPTSNS